MVEQAKYVQFVKELELRHPHMQIDVSHETVRNEPTTGTLITHGERVTCIQRLFNGQVLAQAWYRKMDAPKGPVQITYCIEENWTVIVVKE